MNRQNWFFLSGDAFASRGGKKRTLLPRTWLRDTAGRPDSRRLATFAAWGLWSVFVLTLTLAIWLSNVAGGGQFTEYLAGSIVLIVAFGAYTTVGAVVASRRPGNAVGRSSAPSESSSARALAEVYAYYSLDPSRARAFRGARRVDHRLLLDFRAPIEPSG